MRNSLRAAFVIAAFSAVACSGGPTAATQVRSVAGTWDADFIGVIQGSGHTQDDRIVMELIQTGSGVSGNVRAAGTVGVFPVSGAVTGSILKYTATGTIPESGCSVQVSGELTLDTAGTRLSGPQTHRTCEGVAIGTLSATRR